MMSHLDGVNMAVVSVDDDTAGKIANGRALSSLGIVDGREGELRVVLNSRNELIAVYRRASTDWKPEVVMPAPLA